MKPQIKLVSCLGVLCLAVIALCMISKTGAYADGAFSSALKENESVVSIIGENGLFSKRAFTMVQDENYYSEDLSYLYEAELLEGCDTSGYVGTTGVSVVSGSVAVYLGSTDSNASTGLERQDNEPEGKTEKGNEKEKEELLLVTSESGSVMMELDPDSPDPTPTPDPYGGLTKEEWEFNQYRKTPEYFNSLLVTSEEHYNAEVVENAMRLAALSEEERHILLTGEGDYVYYTDKLPKSFSSAAKAEANMKTIDVPVWKMDNLGNKYKILTEITVHKEMVDSVRCIFSDIFLTEDKFPFNHLVGFMYRKVGGSGMVDLRYMSMHAFGEAIDINHGDYDNDMYLGKGNDLRDKSNPYCITDEVISIFAKYGWYWGGNYDICTDTMHFQYFDLDFLQYDTEEPFPVLYYEMEEKPNNDVLKNLQQRLVKLGYLTKDTYKTFNKTIRKAVKEFQKSQGLEETGIVDYATWVPLINLTHDMNYVF